MATSLKKGNTFNLTKKEPTLKKIMIGLGWEVKPGATLDLDTSVFMLNASGKLPDDAYFVLYNNLNSPDGSIKHTGDNRTGAGDEDDEMILANLDAIGANISEILTCLTIHDAEARKHNFGLLSDVYIRTFDVETKREILRYDLDAEYPTNTDVEFGRLRRENGEWIFVASGIGGDKGLQGYVDAYA
jgi:tellurium resistance protein TerD